MIKNKKWLIPLFALCAVALLHGCDDEELMKLGKQRLTQAKTQLKEVQDLGAAQTASTNFTLASNLVTDGEVNLNKHNFNQANKNWDDFQLLMPKLKAQVLAARDKNQSQLSQQEAAAKLEEERKKAAELSAQQQALLEQQRKLEAEKQEQAKALQEQQRLLAEQKAAQEKAVQEAAKKVSAPTPVAPVVVPVKAPISVSGKVIISKGETLCQLARIHYNDMLKWKDIYKKNKGKIKNPNLIYPGQTIVLP